MNNAILIHGACDREEYMSDKYPSLSNSHWFPWLQKQLLMKGVFTQTPEMPKPYQPDYEKWEMVFEQFPVDQQTILVGHSCGGGFLVRWLSENKIKIRKLILVAPWFDPKREETTTFFDFTIDPKLTERNSVDILYSDNDYESIKTTVKQIHEVLPKVTMHHFHNMGHFCYNDMKTGAFPDLLKIILD